MLFVWKPILHSAHVYSAWPVWCWATCSYLYNMHSVNYNVFHFLNRNSYFQPESLFVFLATHRTCKRSIAVRVDHVIIEWMFVWQHLLARWTFYWFTAMSRHMHSKAVTIFKPIYAQMKIRYQYRLETSTKKKSLIPWTTFSALYFGIVRMGVKSMLGHSLFTFDYLATEITNLCIGQLVNTSHMCIQIGYRKESEIMLTKI